MKTVGPDIIMIWAMISINTAFRKLFIAAKNNSYLPKDINSNTRSICLFFNYQNKVEEKSNNIATSIGIGTNDNYVILKEVSKCGAFSGPYVPVFGLNTEIYLF